MAVTNAAASGVSDGKDDDVGWIGGGEPGDARRACGVGGFADEVGDGTVMLRAANHGTALWDGPCGWGGRRRPQVALVRPTAGADSAMSAGVWEWRCTA